jgi:serine/threonine-protein kinase
LLGRPVAVKLLSAAHASDEQFRERFRAEARYAASLSHPGIARVYDYGESIAGAGGEDLPMAGGAYLVMELVEGEPLSATLAREGRMTPAATLDIVAQAARALAVAHEAGIAHRDIKPGNLLITRDGQVKITDFGIARAVLAAHLTQSGMVMGTAQYVSPEQASAGPITTATDIYSLGVVAYECLAGRPPFTAETPIALALAHVRNRPPRLPAAGRVAVRRRRVDHRSRRAGGPGGLVLRSQSRQPWTRAPRDDADEARR